MCALEVSDDLKHRETLNEARHPLTYYLTQRCTVSLMSQPWILNIP